MNRFFQRAINQSIFILKLRPTNKIDSKNKNLSSVAYYQQIKYQLILSTYIHVYEWNGTRINKMLNKFLLATLPENLSI